MAADLAVKLKFNIFYGFIFIFSQPYPKNSTMVEYGVFGGRGAVLFLGRLIPPIESNMHDFPQLHRASV